MVPARSAQQQEVPRHVFERECASRRDQGERSRTAERNASEWAKYTADNFMLISSDGTMQSRGQRLKTVAENTNKPKNGSTQHQCHNRQYAHHHVLGSAGRHVDLTRLINR